MSSSHFYISTDMLPDANASREEWERRTVMLAGMLEQMTRSLYEYLRAAAPVLVSGEQIAGHMLGSIGLVAKGIHISGLVQLQKAGVEPLDAEDDQARLIADRLANPAISTDEREFLLALQQHRTECGTAHTFTGETPLADDTDFPAEGFVIGGDE